MFSKSSLMFIYILRGDWAVEHCGEHNWICFIKTAPPFLN